MNQVREKLKAGRVSYGVWIEVMSVELVEVCGDLGYDFAVLDAEHQTLNAMACFELVRACQLSGIAPMVRVPSDDPSVIRGFLETGCKGVYVPHVKTGAQARRLVAETQTQPNDDVMILALVEEKEGIDNLEEISATEGVDVIGIGKADLSKSMGYEGRVDHPEVIQVVQTAQRRILASGGAFDALVTTVEEAEDAITTGALAVVVSVRGAIRNVLAQVLGETTDIAISRR